MAGLSERCARHVQEYINFSSLWSGYITYFALPRGSSSNVVIGLANGFITAGSPWPFSTPESQIAADLLGGSQAEQTDLVNFFLNNLTAFSSGGQPRRSGIVLEFSNAVNLDAALRYTSEASHL